jgi:uracil-DNA glycosylase family 4
VNELHAAVVACERCPRLRRYCAEVARVKVRRYRDETYWGRPVPGFGDPRARMLIIGLAPAAHGGNRTGRVFTGDDSGNWLYGTLYKFGFSSRERSLSRDDGLRLHDCYITAAAHCAPPANKPTRAEIDRCGLYLEQELALLTRLRLVVTLGRIAHDAWLRSSGWWDRLPPGKRPPFGHGLLTRLPDGKSVLAAYHPSRQNTQTGRLTRPMWETIFRRARRLLDTERPGGLDA